jgi:alpha-glucosidase
VHNVYGQLMAQATVEGVRHHNPGERPFTISRSGYAGIQRHALTWTGDNESSWEHLRLCIPMV